MAPLIRWTFVDADAAERVVFVDPDSVVRLADPVPVLPPNRFREVRRIVHDGRVYYLKIFHRTQLKNRVRNRLTAPRTTLDADREAAVAAALHQRGIAAPRVLATGRTGPCSFFLCAELSGQSLRERRLAGRLPQTLADAAARFAGAVVAGGVALPDLSADHVFVLDDPDPRGAPRFAVLDLHNGAVRPPSDRDLRRSLRRFARSVRGLGIERKAALRFAVLYLRAAGRSPRATLERLPPFDTHGRYDAIDRDVRYRDRNPERAAAENELLLRIWPGRVGDRILDSPCGAGRLVAPLTGTGALWHGADRSLAMLMQATAIRPDPALAQADAVDLPFRDRSFDGVVVFRFLHHLAPATAQQAVQEAARVADRFVVASFFHPISAHNLERRGRELLTGRARTRHTLTLAQLRSMFAAVGFRATAHVAQARYQRDLWLAAFERVR